MYSIGLLFAETELVRDIYTDNRSKITLTGGETEFIPWKSGTVQGCPLSPTIFNICFEELLRRLEKADMKEFGYGIPMEDGTTIKINAAAYADDLVLYADAHEHMEIMLAILLVCQDEGQRRKMRLVVTGLDRGKSRQRPRSILYSHEKGAEEIPMEMVSICLGMPIGFNKYEQNCSRQ
jgi:hypothetical protein